MPFLLIFTNLSPTLPPPCCQKVTLTLPPQKPTPPPDRGRVDPPPMVWVLGCSPMCDYNVGGKLELLYPACILYVKFCKGCKRTWFDFGISQDGWSQGELIQIFDPMDTWSNRKVDPDFWTFDPRGDIIQSKSFFPLSYLLTYSTEELQFIVFYFLRESLSNHLVLHLGSVVVLHLCLDHNKTLNGFLSSSLLW